MDIPGAITRWSNRCIIWKLPGRLETRWKKPGGFASSSPDWIVVMKKKWDNPLLRIQGFLLYWKLSTTVYHFNSWCISWKTCNETEESQVNKENTKNAHTLWESMLRYLILKGKNDNNNNNKLISYRCIFLLTVLTQAQHRCFPCKGTGPPVIWLIKILTLYMGTWDYNMTTGSIHGSLQ